MSVTSTLKKVSVTSIVEQLYRAGPLAPTIGGQRTRRPIQPLRRGDAVVAPERPRSAFSGARGRPRSIRGLVEGTATLLPSGHAGDSFRGRACADQHRRP